MSEKEIFLFKRQNYVTGSGDKYRSELHVIVKFYIIVKWDSKYREYSSLKSATSEKGKISGKGEKQR